MKSDELRSILRKGDPAAGDPGLTPEEVQAMRRTVLSAVPEPRRRGWLVPAMVTAAALVLAAVLALSLWQPGMDVAGPEPSPPWPPSPTSPFPSLGEGGTGEQKIAIQGRVEAPLSRRGGRGGGRGDGGEGLRKPEPPEPEPIVVVAHQTQIQFSTPGGTRIIWVLQPVSE
jgi:hypothetical protein